MALTKDNRYWIQLRTAITAGQWDSESLGKDTKGRTLNWANLLRKFNKHCPGQNEFSEVVSQTHHLYLQLAASQQTYGLQRFQTGPLDLGDEIILPVERHQEGQAGCDVLGAIPSPSEVRPAKPHIFFPLNHDLKSVLLALAYYAYSLSRPSESLDILSKVKDLTHPLKRISAPTSTTPASGASQHGTEHTPSWAGSFSTVEHSHVNPDIKVGRAWSSIETVRSVCLKGIFWSLICYRAITYTLEECRTKSCIHRICKARSIYTFPLPFSLKRLNRKYLTPFPPQVPQIPNPLPTPST